MGKSMLSSLIRSLTILSMICGAWVPRCSAADDLLVYMGPHIGGELERFLAQKAKPTTATSEDGETASSVITRQCGHVSDVLVSEAKKLNPSLTTFFAENSPSLAIGTQIVVPACAYWEVGPIPYITKDNETLEQIASNFVGHSGKRTTGAIKFETKRNEPALANVDLDRYLKEGDRLYLPYLSRPVRLQPIDGSIGEFVTELQAKSAASKTNGISYSVEDRFEFIVEAKPGLSNLSCAGSGSGYPLSEDDVTRVIKLNDWFASTFARNPYGNEPVVILVVDDGIQGSEAVELGDEKTYPKSIPIAFAHAYSAGESSQVDNTFGQRYDEFSTDRLAPTISYLPIPHNGNMLHGTHVTGILLGGGFARTFPELFKGRFKIAHRNVVSRVEGASIWKFNPSYTTLAIRDLDNIEKTSHEKVIINLSAAGIGEIAHIDQKLNQEDALLVVAAGNESSDLDDSKIPNIYPANYGGEHSTNVISVAALDATTSLMWESNYGRRSVDVSAPGCEIVSNVGGQSENLKAMSGTSMAAPFVTLTAAILANYGMQLDDVKRRIWKTVDVGDPDSQSKIGSGGRLNIPRALALGFDTVTTKSGSLLFGALRQQVFKLCGETPDSEPEDIGPEAFERVDFNNPPSCNQSLGQVCVQMAMQFKGDSDRHDMRRLRADARRCKLSEDLITGETVKFVAVEQSPTTNEIFTREEDLPLSDIRNIVPSELSGSTLQPYRNAIVRLHDSR